MERVVSIEGIGQVTFAQSRQARQITLSIRPHKGVRVSYPPGVSEAQVLHFLAQKKEWIRSGQARMAAHEQELHDARTHFTPSMQFATRYHTLHFEAHSFPQYKIRICNGKILVRYPQTADHQDFDFQQAARYAIEKAWRLEAQRLFPARVEQWARQLNLRVARVKITQSKGRWGSCSSTNNINLSLYLMQLPDHLIDYVILHELAHVIEKNHGPGFWALLNRFCNNRAKEYDKAVNVYRIGIY